MKHVDEAQFAHHCIIVSYKLEFVQLAKASGCKLRISGVIGVPSC